jgi:hypothetical protein
MLFNTHIYVFRITFEGANNETLQDNSLHLDNLHQLNELQHEHMISFCQ